MLNRLNIISILEAGGIFSFKKKHKKDFDEPVWGPESYMKPLLCDLVNPGVEMVYQRVDCSCTNCGDSNQI